MVASRNSFSFNEATQKDSLIAIADRFSLLNEKQEDELKGLNSTLNKEFKNHVQFTINQ